MTVGDEDQELRAAHRDSLDVLRPALAGRTSWSRDEISAERLVRLRALLDAARAASPWHASRLARVTVRTLTEADLPTLPTMTKDDVDRHFDRIVTDPRVSRRVVNEHLMQLEHGVRPRSYLLERYTVVTSLGVNRFRTPFVFDWDGWLMAGAGVGRCRDVTASGLADERTALLVSHKPSDIWSAVSSTFFPRTSLVPATLPEAGIVMRLNALRPTRIEGFPSALLQLCRAAQTGHLAIAPRLVTGVWEPMLPHVRTRIERSFPARVTDAYACAETGVLAVSCPAGAGLHLFDDLTIVELFDRHNRPVGPGRPSDKILVTNLSNTILPLIRYEVHDIVTALESSPPCRCGSSHRTIAPVIERAEDMFVYDSEVSVRSSLFDVALTGEPGLWDYQVRQSPEGAHILVVGERVDERGVAAAVEASLAGAGVTSPRVTVECVDFIPRTSGGTVLRFVPLHR